VGVDDTSTLKVNLTKEGTFEYEDHEDFEKYIGSLKHCKKLEQDLEMNFDVSRNSRASAEISLGLFYQIEDEIKKVAELLRK
jgi:hypothetical protein